MKPDKKLTRQTVAGFWRFTKAYKLQFSIGAGGAVLAVVAQSILAPLIVSRTFAKLQTGYAHHNQLNFNQFYGYILLYALTMAAGVILWRVQSYFTWQLEIRTVNDMIRAVFAHLSKMSQRFHADRFSGALVSQSTKYVGAYERMMDDFIWNILPGLSTLVFSVAVLAFVSPPYAIGMFGLSLVYIGLMYRRITKQMPVNTAAAKSESDQTAALADAVTNIDTIRAFGNEEYENERFAGAARKVLEANDRLSKEVFKSEALSHVQTNTFQVLAVTIGLIAVTRSHANISLLYLLISYTQAIVSQILQFSRIVRNVNRSLGDAVEMTQILELEPEIKDARRPLKSAIHRGQIEFKSVTFYYPETPDRPLFKELDLKIKPGEKVGLVGPSGGGKTTITKLMLRFMDIQKGEIAIDGQNIANLSQQDLRHKIAYVPQEPMLFHRSLTENISYGNLHASAAEIEAVAKMAHAHDFISRLNKGYDTLVGERGIKLSGGQRQRVAIARAMLKNAPILILDEATSALDSVSEILIQDALWKLMENRTAIIIAHRLSTIQKMDRIIVLDQGKIVEQGTHKELLRLGGVYAELWAHQSGGFMED